MLQYTQSGFCLLCRKAPKVPKTCCSQTTEKSLTLFMAPILSSLHTAGRPSRCALTLRSESKNHSVPFLSYFWTVRARNLSLCEICSGGFLTLFLTSFEWARGATLCFVLSLFLTVKRPETYKKKIYFTILVRSDLKRDFAQSNRNFCFENSRLEKR